MKTKQQNKQQKQNSNELQSRSEQLSGKNNSQTGKAPEQTPTSQPSEWRGVFFQGPEPMQDRQTGDEIPSWAVFVGNHDADPRGKVYTVYSFTRAQALAQAMAKDRNLELIAEAQPAGPLPVAA